MALSTRASRRNQPQSPPALRNTRLLSPSASYSSPGIVPKREESELSPAYKTEGTATSSSFYQRRSNPTSFPIMNEFTRASSRASSKTEGGAEVFINDHIKDLVDAINDLQKFDLDHVAPLPEIVVVGDQSAAKSSLICAFTAMKMPRSVGCCTKVPANIKVSPSDTWSCTVSLHQKYKYQSPSRPIEQKDVTSRNPFPGWVEGDLVEKKFKEISDKSEFEEVMRWAQIALLNPTEHYKYFIPGSGTRHEKKDTTEDVGFSPNIISVEISGPGLPVLSFFDLPGIILNSPKPETEYLVKVFENLAIKYIKRKNAIIVYCLTMSVDPVLSRTGKIIRDHKAEDRTIGILTKPDTLGAKHDDFEKILMGYEHQLGHGYFVTKQPGPDSNLSGPDYHHLARQEENLFFEEDPLWRGDWVGFQPRCGTFRIQKYLSQQLAVQISKSIPDIAKKIDARAQDIEVQLLSLPELPGADIQHVVLRRLLQFSTHVQRLLDGEVNGDNGFQSSWNTLTEQFQKLIMFIKPRIIVADSSDKDGPVIIDLLETEDEEELLEVAQLTTPSKRKANELHGASGRNTPATPGTGGALFKSEGAPRPRQLKPEVNPFEGTPFAKYSNLGRNFSAIGEIQKLTRARTMTGNVVHPKVYNELSMLSVGPWMGPLVTLLDESTDLLLREILSIHKIYFGDWQQTELSKQSQLLLENFLKHHRSMQLQALEDIHKLETYRLFTTNTTMLDNFAAKELQDLLKVRKTVRARILVDRQLLTGARKLPRNLDFQDRAKEKKKLVDAVKDEELGLDPFQTALEVAARVRGYYVTAAHRFVDNACLSMSSRLCQMVHYQIDGFLENELGIHGVDGKARCKELMEEDEMVASRRRRLKKERENLSLFAARLEQLRIAISGPSEDNYRHNRYLSPVTEMMRNRNQIDEDHVMG